jgi:hypothetical protein
MTTLPAVVTIVDLTVATSLSSAALFEAVQTTNGSIESVAVSVTQIMTTAFGILPTGGATGQLLLKNSGTNYDTGWISPSSFVTANSTSGLTVTGSTSLALALQSVAGLSVLGVGTTSTAIPLPVTGTAGQVLRVNDAGTSLAFGAINLASAAAVTGILGVPQGGTNTSALTAKGILFGSTATAVGVTAAGNTSVPLLGGGAGNNPSFGVLPVIGGGSGTTAFSAYGVVLAGTTATGTFQNAAVSTAGNILIDQGTAAIAAFKAVSGDVSLTSTGVITIGTNVVSYAKIQQGTGLAVLGFATTAASNATTFVASAAYQTLQVATTGTSLAWALPAMVLLNTISPNGVATCGDTTSFTTTFGSYLITFHGVFPSNSTANLQLTVATSGANFTTNNYQGGISVIAFGTSTTAVDAGTTAILLSGTRSTTNITTTAGVGVSGFVRVFNPAGSTARKIWVGELAYYNSTLNNPVIATPYGYYDGNNALTGFQIAFSPGNIATGTIKVYGLT